jgi:5-methylcytosine-specific restriction endonuclease McrA
MSEGFYISKTWKQLRIMSLKRDNYFCVECRQRGRPFVRANTVHHLISREDSPELALDLANLVSLCAACHNRAHPEKSIRRAKSKIRVPKSGVRIIKL